MVDNVIAELQKEFIAEAISAPKLFSDLGKVEQYIAESYKTRSFIELIQNADDANSSAFGIYLMDNTLVVANNGRPFTSHDIEALCRSGSSNKSRGGSTIGYRGIGFKSVVNLAKRIYIISDDFKFYFDKEATRKLLPEITALPLIRVLHPYDDNSESLRITSLLKQLADLNGYTTFFIFCDVDDRLIKQELQDFDRNALLFLNNVCNVTCQVNSINREIIVTKQYRNNKRLIEIQEGSQADTWEIISSPKDPRDMIAFKVMDETIIPATLEESVVHSFTPTVELAGAFIKINGDYSTDPSRKNIDFDEFSTRSFFNALTLLIDTTVDVLEGKVVRKGFFTPFVNIPNLEGNKFKSKLYRGITEGLNSRKLKINGTRIAFSALRLRPDWLNHEDYEKICTAGFCSINKEMLSVYPELPDFMRLVGVKHLSLIEVPGVINEADISFTGAAQITAKIISQHRFDLTKERVAEISSLKLFPKGNKLVSALEVESTGELDKDFVSYLVNHVEASDLKLFASKIEIKHEASLQEIAAPPAAVQTIRQVELPSETTVSTATAKPVFKSTPKLQKWRSAEKNALEYLQAMSGVLVVSDVSAANMGYDLDVMLENGKRIYVEVKSVSSFNEPIKITNNEYSSAHNYGESYYLAIAINDEPFQMKLVCDPIKNLSFQKQIERWSWSCDSYSCNLSDITNLI